VAPVQSLRTGDPAKVGDYAVLGRLGQGAMGRVYLARSPGGRLVAVKVVRPELADDAGFRERFRHEVASMRAVGGFWTAAVVDTDPSELWLATEYVPGPTLFAAVAAHGPLPTPALHGLLAGLAEALRAIHGAGLVHRDLKPANVLLATDGPRVIDFGIAKALESVGLTATGMVVGTPGFLSPEQIEGRDATPASDVFALGAVLTYAATGMGPFGTGDHAALLYRAVHTTPTLDEVPLSLRPLLARCLAREPGARPSPSELLASVGTPEGPDWLPANVREMVTEQETAMATPSPRPPTRPYTKVGPPLPFGGAPRPPAASPAEPAGAGVGSAAPGWAPAVRPGAPGSAPHGSDVAGSAAPSSAASGSVAPGSAEPGLAAASGSAAPGAVTPGSGAPGSVPRGSGVPGSAAQSSAASGSVAPGSAGPASIGPGSAAAAGSAAAGSVAPQPAVPSAGSGAGASQAVAPGSPPPGGGNRAVFRVSRVSALVLAGVSTVAAIVCGGIAQDSARLGNGGGALLFLIAWLLLTVSAVRFWWMVVRRRWWVEVSGSGLAVGRGRRTTSLGWGQLARVRVVEGKRPWLVVWTQDGSHVDLGARYAGGYRVFPVGHERRRAGRQRETRELRAALGWYGRAVYDPSP
jgi:eukaryotic-like serine/threonine-protein kinase